MKKRLSLILCVVLLCQLLSGCGKTTETVREPDDAYRCYYEIFVGSFCDSDGDKCGDLSGITEKLDYIEEALMFYQEHQNQEGQHDPMQNY